MTLFSIKVSIFFHFHLIFYCILCERYKSFLSKNSKDGKPVVRLVPLYHLNEEDPCRIISDLTINTGDEGISPLSKEDWDDLF